LAYKIVCKGNDEHIRDLALRSLQRLFQKGFITIIMTSEIEKKSKIALDGDNAKDINKEKDTYKRKCLQT
jgi:hypothetical protein